MDIKKVYVPLCKGTDTFNFHIQEGIEILTNHRTKKLAAEDDTL